jgi:hypothetical protein
MARFLSAQMVRRPDCVLSIGLAILYCTVLASCESPPALGQTDGSAAPTGPDGAPDAEVGACPAPITTSPCRVDSDCQNPYLVCERPSSGVFVCRDAQAIVASACPSLVDATNVPTCPTTEPVPSASVLSAISARALSTRTAGRLDSCARAAAARAPGFRPNARRRLTAQRRGTVTRHVRVPVPRERKYANRPSPCSVVQPARPRSPDYAWKQREPGASQCPDTAQSGPSKFDICSVCNIPPAHARGSVMPASRETERDRPLIVNDPGGSTLADCAVRYSIRRTSSEVHLALTP